MLPVFVQLSVLAHNSSKMAIFAPHLVALHGLATRAGPEARLSAVAPVLPEGFVTGCRYCGRAAIALDQGLVQVGGDAHWRTRNV